MPFDLGRALHVPDPLLGVLHQELAYEILRSEQLIQLLACCCRHGKRKRRLDDVDEGPLVVLAFERRPAVDHLVEEHPERPPVDGAAVAGARDHLGREVLVRPDERLRPRGDGLGDELRVELFLITQVIFLGRLLLPLALIGATAVEAGQHRLHGRHAGRAGALRGGEEGVVKRAEDLLLGLRTLELLAESERLPVDHLHGVEAAQEAGVAEPAKIDVAEVAAPEATHEAEVLKADAARGCTETLDGLPLGLIRFVGLQLLLLASAAAGAGGDGAGSAEADVANPAPAGFEGSAKGRAAAVVVGVVSAGGDCHGLARSTFGVQEVGF
ncbi:hypothetical protein C4D60_Mb10t04180 [Musa balbisiana]|uniref:Uncharacterized protein n=1 Tax=Musa balbisiana TaxID=52838 RepID=A0A4S8IUJ0_MUSBA|nr:hypothetical protein C4D60_Mb10t04180 [Musa balbisiana]